MSLAANNTFGTRPANPVSLEDILTYIESLAIALSGTMGESDIDTAAITYLKARPGPFFFGAGTRSGAAGSESYAVTLSPAALTLATGLWFYFSADAALTGATAQLNVNGLGAKYIKKFNLMDLQAGDIA